MVIRDVDIDGDLTDIRLANGIIAEIGKAIHGEEYFDGKGGALLPGLHDHHIHLNATAAAMNSVRCGPPDVQNEAELVAVLNGPGSGWLRGVGYHHSVAGEINRPWLDMHGPKRPVRIQHRSGRMWILNTLAMNQLNITQPVDGRLVDQDLLIRAGKAFPDLNPLKARLFAYGITGVTEVTPTNGPDEIDNYRDRVPPLKLAYMGRADLDRGHRKLHYHDHDLPPLDALIQEIKAAHDQGRNVAAHCVTRAELMLTLAAIDEAGAMTGDRIEHAAIADDDAIHWMKRLELIVVTQPNFIAERGTAYAKDVPADDHKNLWRLKSFMDAGLKVAAGSDAPFGDPNPWKAMHAAVNRSPGFDFGETVSPETALELYTKPVDNAGGAPRQIRAGEPADLCLLDRPWTTARQNLAVVNVQATWIDGDLVFNRVN